MCMRVYAGGGPAPADQAPVKVMPKEQDDKETIMSLFAGWIRWKEQHVTVI